MHIAIIEDSDSYREIIKSRVKDSGWDVDFFVNASDFGRANLSSYDVIVADYHLPTVSGRELIKSIAPKTSAQMFLMGDHRDNFDEEDVYNERIKGLIDKKDPENVVSELRYIDSKIKLKNLMEQEQNKMGTIFPTNGFSLDLKEDVAVVKVTELLSQSSKDRLLREIDGAGIKKLVLSFSMSGVVTSPYLGLIVFLFKEMKSRGGQMVFWDATKDQTLLEQLKLCNLTMLFPVFNTLKEALESLNKKGAEAPK